MSGMVEKVAKAIFNQDQSSLPVRVHRKPFDDMDEASGVAKRYRGLARAAIAAMREPSHAQILAVPYTLCGMSSFDPPVIMKRTEIEDLWRKLIDAVLAEVDRE